MALISPVQLTVKKTPQYAIKQILKKNIINNFSLYFQFLLLCFESISSIIFQKNDVAYAVSWNNISSLCQTVLHSTSCQALQPCL